jgi:hypothetical protein
MEKPYIFSDSDKTMRDSERIKLIKSLKKLDILKLKYEEYSQIVKNVNGTLIYLLDHLGNESVYETSFLSKVLCKIDSSYQVTKDLKGQLIKKNDVISVRNFHRQEKKGKVIFIQGDFIFVKVKNKYSNSILAKKNSEVSLIKSCFYEKGYRHKLFEKEAIVNRGIYKGFLVRPLKIENRFIEVNILSIGKTTNIPLEYISDCNQKKKTIK